MAIVYVQRKKVQRNLLLVFLAVLLFIGFVVWQGFSSKGFSPRQEETIKTPREEVKINFEVLKNPLLQALQPFSDIQPFKESTTTNEKMGRENPFLPY